MAMLACFRTHPRPRCTYTLGKALLQTLGRNLLDFVGDSTLASGVRGTLSVLVGGVGGGHSDGSLLEEV
jgi:hypothetical protein